VDRAAPLDLKEAPDREILAQVLAEAKESDLWTGGSLDQNYLLLKSYLEGYDLLQGLMPATGVLPLTGPDLARHREMVTREATAVYLKDVLLTIPFPWPATGVELGDCQGSDSPFPQHLAQVLAYLIKSDLALYVVSSRVGLRQADFQFLAELKRMGLMPHILALLNLDLGEHTSYGEVVKLRDRVAQELTSWQPDPQVYAFSALKLLLERRQARGEGLDPREAAVLKVWATDPDSAAFSDGEAARFEQDLMGQNALLVGRNRKVVNSNQFYTRLREPLSSIPRDAYEIFIEFSFPSTPKKGISCFKQQAFCPRGDLRFFQNISSYQSHVFGNLNH